MLRERRGSYDPRLLDVLASLAGSFEGYARQSRPLSGLAPGMPPAPVPDLGTAHTRLRRPQLPSEEPLPRVALRRQAAKDTRALAPGATPRPEKPAAKRTAGSANPVRPAGRSAPTGSPAGSRVPASASFALQTGVFADPGNARGQVAKLRGRGFPACVVEEKGPDGKRYRVLAGRFGDRHTAMARLPEVATAAGSTRAVPQAVDPATAARLR